VAKHSNVVRFIVKDGNQDAFIKSFTEFPACDGLLSHILIQTGENTFCSCGVWRDEDAMVSAMPVMISLLNSSRHLLEEISKEQGVTDPVSGSIVFDQNLSN
jgi:hypothetical protein